MAGRKPKVTTLKVLQGTFRPCRANHEEPQVKIGAPERPKYLKGAARKEWDRLIPYLISVRVLAEQEQGSLAMLCLIHGKMVEAAKEGRILHPSLIAQYRILAGTFGLTPADRQRVKSHQEAKPANEWEDLANDG
jgi:phage terminase small subunit